LKLSTDTTALTRPSGLFLLFCFFFPFFTMDLWRPWHFKQNQFVWDVANYYSYLPAKFCNNNSFDFQNGVEAYLGTSPTEKKISRCTYGMAIMYAPAFALGYKIAYNQKSPLDGFSEPFATVIHWASILYGLLGLVLLRNFLIKFYSELVTTLTLIIVFFGTMLFFYTMSMSEMPHSYLFFLISAFLLLTYHWHQKPTVGKSVLLALVIGLISLVRPTEALVVLIFIFWDSGSRHAIKSNFLKFYRYSFHVLLMIALVVMMWIPQLLFWKNMTGLYFYNSYAALGEKFYWGDPQIMNILFSYRKGWITYTPLIVLSFIGFFLMRNQLKKMRGVLVVLLVLQLYILSCWWDWFFGGCFGSRGFCQHIAYLAIPLAACCEFVLNKDNFAKSLQFIRVIFFVVIFSGISLNLGQTYQYNKNYLHFNSTTKETYWLVFGKYYLDDEHIGKYWDSLDEPDYPKLKSGEDRDQ
jgi:hypothetical protein